MNTFPNKHGSGLIMLWANIAARNTLLPEKKKLIQEVKKESEPVSVGLKPSKHLTEHQIRRTDTKHLENSANFQILYKLL